jgi:hypothetical protein
MHRHRSRLGFHGDDRAYSWSADLNVPCFVSGFSVTAVFQGAGLAGLRGVAPATPLCGAQVNASALERDDTRIEFEGIEEGVGVMVGASGVDYAEEPDLDADEFLALARKIWPREYARESVQEALRETINVVARVEGQLVGSVRILTDGYFFGTIPEILVDPGYQGKGIGGATG